MANQTPSANPADESSLAGVLGLAIRKAMQSVDGMLPVEVVSYDRATNRATVRHLVQMTGANGQAINRADISSIRVLQMGNAAFSVSLPIKPGDKGWILAADRDVSIFQNQGLSAGPPNTDRMHSFQDGLFIPDAMSNGNAPAGQGDRVVIGANGGSAFMSFDADGFEFNFGGNVLTMNAAGLRMNGINIGDDHTHGGIVIGGQNTQVPNP